MASKLEKIELCNFKSYRGKITIGPFKDFSCIVGPNGVGKSNILDALSFLFSTSQAILRKHAPEALINHKSREKECSVTGHLRLANNTEVHLKREMNRHGNFSLSCDGVRLTEKEFAGILRKHRINARVNSFLVFQHEVESVAQKKARELTELIEEISGSGELKQEYLRLKVEMEQANETLAAASIQKRGAIAEVNQMRLHKKEADKFAEVSEKLREERRDLALCELFHIESQLEKHKKELAAQNINLASLESAKQTDEDVKTMKKAYADKHKQYLDLLKKSREAAFELREKRGTLDRISNSLEHYKKKLTREQEDLKFLQQNNKTWSSETRRLEEQLKHQQKILAEFEAQCKKEAEEASKQLKVSPAQLEEYKKLRRDADCETLTLRQENDLLRVQRDSVKDLQRQATITADLQEEQLKGMANLVDHNEQHARAAKRKEEETESLIKELQLKATQARAALQQVQSRTAEQHEELARIESQLHELRFVKEGNRQSERLSSTVHTLKSMYPGVRGTLVDLCTIPISRYKSAVTVALGKNIDAIIVDTTETAMNCVRYLKEQRIGAMSFIPLSGAQGKAVDDRLRTFGGTCKPIIDVIKFDAHLEPAIRYAAGQTLVCDTLVEARKVAFGSGDGQRYKVVTLDGSMLLKNGCVQGGLAAVQSRARKWDEKQYQDLKQAREELLRTSAPGAEEARTLTDVREAESRLDFARVRLKHTQAELGDCARKSKSLASETKKIETILAAARKHAADYGSKISKLEEKMFEFQKQITAIEQKYFGTFQKSTGITNIAQLEKQNTAISRARVEKRQQLENNIHKIKTLLEAELEQAGATKPGDLEESIRKTQKELRTCETDLSTYKKHTENAQAKVDDLGTKVTSSKTDLSELEDKIRKRSQSSRMEIGKLAQARRATGMLQSACDALRQQRASLFQRCRMDVIDLPTVPAEDAGKKRAREPDGAGAPARNKRRGHDDSEVELDIIRISEAFTSFSESDTAKRRKEEAPICIDFTCLPESLRRKSSDNASFRDYRGATESIIDQLERELESIAPNLKASARFSSSEVKLGETATVLEEARERARKTLQDFTRVKEHRVSRFLETYESIGDSVDAVYRELTMGTHAVGIHGSAYLSLEDNDEPYNAGTRYHATPPMKRFMTIELLSGGERTMAALALLFAIHKISPTPFFVLDEIDASLDAANVRRLTNYLRVHSNECQFLVISLKDQLYHVADGLVGIYKDLARESSGCLTLNLAPFNK